MGRAEELRRRFDELFGGEARVYRAPGRVNLIGEHTDYNDGFVMPSAIDLYTWAAIAPRDDRKLKIHSENFNESIEFDLDEAAPRARAHWSDYPRGIAAVLERAGHRLRGANILIRGDVPIGSGLSSSAAIEIATGYALMENTDLPIDRLELALLCQRAENQFVGMRCGIMDQFISCNGRAGEALLLDCRSLDYELLSLAGDVRLVICNTMVKHELASGEYNARRAECEAGVRHLAKHLPHARALRDVTLAELEQHGRDLPEVIYRRCQHVISENDRVIEAAAALRRGDLIAFGQLMRESHRSLRDDYEVSCAELDLMVDLANKVEGVYGARMTGGGFGGCTINLVKAESIEDFKREVAHGYEKATGRTPEIYICGAAEGAEQVMH
ncbi:MAG TPA: galactokinase [Blastocatellia bacterium]|nr:galactokinase [Blastocatellia bacterium]